MLERQDPRLGRAQADADALALKLAGSPVDLKAGPVVDEADHLVVALLELQCVGETDAGALGTAAPAGRGSVHCFDARRPE